MTMTMTRLVPQHGRHPCYPLQCQEHQLHGHALHLSYRPLPWDLFLMTLLLQVDPTQLHNQAHRHFQGSRQHQALLLILRGHVLHHCATVPWWHWHNTISRWPKQHGLHTPWPSNFPAYAKHWCFWNLSWQNLPASARGWPLWTRDTALWSWIRSPANYSSIATSNETHASKRFGTNHTQMNSGNFAKALVRVTKLAAKGLQEPTRSTLPGSPKSLTTSIKRLSTWRWCVQYMKGRMKKMYQDHSWWELNLQSRWCRHQYIASLELIKLMLNSVILRKGAWFSTIDIKNFYLDMPMVDPKYVRIKITDIPEEFILEYEPAGKEDHNGWIYFEIWCGCYGLPQAGILANNLLHGGLEKGGLLQSRYDTRPLETQMVANSILSIRQQFWSEICGNWTLQPSPCSPTTVLPSPNQYGRQQDCRLKSPIGFPQQASMHWHEI